MRQALFPSFAKWSTGTLLCLCALSAHAFRSAVFPTIYRPRVLFWVDQEEFFKNETAQQKKRPIWLHTGDSISSGWASHSALRDVLNQVQAGIPQPEAGTIEFYRRLLPLPESTWYAGSPPSLSLLGKLLKNDDWVLYSTALAGALLSSANRNPLLLTDQLPRAERSRVELLTMSLGTNDLCDGTNPFQILPQLEAKTDALLKSFPNAKRVAFAAAHPIRARALLMSRIEKIADPIVRKKMQDYCQKSWLANCSQPDSAELDANYERVQSYLRKNFGPDLIDFAELNGDFDLLDAFAADCFHPSRNIQPKIVESILKRL